jgi:hypothetical protein
MFRTSRPVAVLLVSLLVMAGACSDDDGGDEGAPSSTPGSTAPASGTGADRDDGPCSPAEGAAPGTDLTHVFDDTARLTRHHRNSDYGAVLRDVVDHHLAAIGHRTTVLVLGDARSNGTDPRLADLREIVERAGHVLWLNPEPARSWGTGDSVAHRYAEIVDMHECRNVAQLRQFVTRVLPVR